MAKKKTGNVDVVVVAGGRGGRRGGPRNATGPRAQVGLCPFTRDKPRG